MKKIYQLVVLVLFTLLLSVPAGAEVLPEPLEAIIVLNKTSVAVGQPITAAWTVTGGKNPYEVSAYWVITEANSSEEQWFNAEVASNSSALTPKFGVAGYLYLEITDADGREKLLDSAEFSITGAAVVDPLQAVPTLNKETVAVGNPITASWTIMGGKQPYEVWGTWVIEEVGSEDVYLDANIFGNSSVLRPTCGTRGYFDLSVTDADGRFRSFRLANYFFITGSTVVDPLEAVITLDKTTVAVGQPITAIWTISGGRAPYEADAWWWITEVNSSEKELFSASVDNNRSTFTPKFGEKGYFSVDIRDADGRYEEVFSPTFGITGAVAADPLQASVTLDKTSVTVGQPITALWFITGGTAPYEVGAGSWWITEANSSEEEYFSAEIVNNSSTLTPTRGVSGRLVFDVTDAVGRTAFPESPTFSIMGAVAVNPLNAVITLDKKAVSIGGTITASWQVSGGRDPRVSLAYWVLTDSYGAEYALDAVISQGNSSKLRPQFGESGVLSIDLRDADGRVKSFESVTFSIVGDSNPASLACTVTLNKESVAVGTPITGNWTITGGREPYSIDLADSSWHILERPVLNWSSVRPVVEGNSSTFTPAFGQEVELLIKVTDADGRSVYGDSPRAYITGAGTTTAPLQCDIVLDKTSVNIGSPITAHYTIQGGVPPYMTQSVWFQLSTNEDVMKGAEFTSDKEIEMGSVFTPTQGVKGFYRVFVTDAQGRNAYFLLTDSFTILPAADPALPGDANGDSTIDIMDLVAIIDYIVSDTSPSALSNADANGDGTVDIMDLVWIIDQIVGG